MSPDSWPVSAAVRPPVSRLGHAAAMIASAHQRATGHRLAREWTRLRRRPDVLRHAARWGLLDQPIGDLDEVLTAIGYEVRATPATEQALRRLVLVAAGDELAARVVVQRLLPGLLATVRRRRRAGRSDDVFDELLGAAWIAVRTYNPARSPACLAAALIADADYRAFRSERRLMRSTETPIEAPDEAALVEPDPTPRDELVELFDLALTSGVAGDDLELLRQLIVGRTATEAAAALRVTPRTVRNRRRRIALRLRRVALAA